MKLSDLLEIGVYDDLEFYQKREVRVINLFSLITIAGLVVGVSTVFFAKNPYPLTTVLGTLFCAITSMFLNYKKQQSAATYLFVIAVNFSIFTLNQQYTLAVGNYLYYFPLIFCIALIHNPSKPIVRTIMFFAITFTSFVLALWLKIDSLKIPIIDTKNEHTLFMYNCTLTVIITIILVFLVVNLINKQNNEVILLLQKEHDAQSKATYSLKEKETLLAEIQHRVKNNLAVITGLLNLQMEKAPCDVSRGLMIESRNRVMSIAMIHERLYKKDNLSKIDLKQYLSELVNEVVKSFPAQTKIQIIEDMEDLELELTKAVPAGLIVNELVTNSLKHAFPPNITSPVITIQMKRIFDCMQISFSDNGIGFGDIEKRKETSLGITLIESLADQIDAKVSFRNNNGAYVNLVFAV